MHLKLANVTTALVTVPMFWKSGITPPLRQVCDTLDQTCGVLNGLALKALERVTDTVAQCPEWELAREAGLLEDLPLARIHTFLASVSIPHSAIRHRHAVQGWL